MDTTYVEHNNTYTGGYDYNITKRFQEMCLLMSNDSEQYSRIWYDLKKSTLLGTKNYPSTPTAAYDVLCRYKNPASQRQAHTPPGAVMFVHSDNADRRKTVPVNDGRSFEDVT